MGSAKKIRRKYTTPSHPWQKERLDEEGRIRKIYATGNKAEIWKMNSKLKSFLNTAKRVSYAKTPQEKIEREQMQSRMIKLGLLKEGQNLDDILSLKIDSIMDRRLQTLVFKKELALTAKQARQMITHKHIKVGDKIITSPSYIVRADEESLIQYSHKSPFASADHPERTKKSKDTFESTEKEAKGKKGRKKGGKKEGNEDIKEEEKDTGTEEEIAPAESKEKADKEIDLTIEE